MPKISSIIICLVTACCSSEFNAITEILVCCFSPNAETCNSGFHMTMFVFQVEGANEQYKLTIGEYSGNAGDSFVYHNKMAFSTEDMDNDLHERHCAAENKVQWSHLRNCW